jgi:hypothetical protein
LKRPPTELARLHKRMRGEIEGLELEPAGMRATIDTRYAALEMHFDFDAQARSLRVYVSLPTPVGGGVELLRWCLSMNTLYWDVKIGLDAEGGLLVLSDVDIDHGDLAVTARVVVGRVAAMCELIEDDLVDYLLSHRLATPAQVSRWTTE